MVILIPNPLSERFWHHQHLFKEVGRDVEIQDIVHQAMPLWPVGEMVHSTLVGKKVEAIFDFRSRAIDRIYSKRCPSKKDYT